jgi:predicted nucleic acid-binding protein
MSFMSGKVFLDTNVLVYAFDAFDAKKHKTAMSIVDKAFRQKNGIISTQVLKEFFVTVTRKISVPLDTDEAKLIVENLSVLEVVDTTVPLIISGIDICKKHSLSFWDSLIVAAAKISKCSILISEDLSHGTKIEGIAVKNPFL